MRAAFRPRSYVRVAGPDAEEYLDRMVSNDVAALGPGEACEALLLTPKARVIAPLVVLRRGHEDFLLLTEPELGERVRAELAPLPLRGEGGDRARGAHLARRLRRRGDPDRATTASPPPRCSTPTLEATVSAEELELLRIRAGTPRGGRRSTTASCPPRPA